MSPSIKGLSLQTRHQNLFKTRCLECLPSGNNQGEGSVEDQGQNTPWTLQISGHAIWVNQCPHHCSKIGQLCFLHFMHFLDIFVYLVCILVRVWAVLQRMLENKSSREVYFYFYLAAAKIKQRYISWQGKDAIISTTRSNGGATGNMIIVIILNPE